MRKRRMSLTFMPRMFQPLRFEASSRTYIFQALLQVLDADIDHKDLVPILKTTITRQIVKHRFVHFRSSILLLQFQPCYVPFFLNDSLYSVL